MRSCVVVFTAIFAALLSLTNGECGVDNCKVPTHVYHDLRCIPKYASNGACCPEKYDCSHIYNRPKGTCHFRGKFYKPGEKPDKEDTAGNCDHSSCKCTENQDFSCIAPSDTCAEFWVPEFIQPGCYLNYELNRCCSNGQKCPPFDDTAKCTVNGVTYKEGQRFEHPHEKCTLCVCGKGFDGKFDESFCQKRNCSTEQRYSKEIDNYCAPVYKDDWDSCCPRKWICPSENGTHIPASTPPTDPNLQCKFGDKILLIGEKYEDQDRSEVRPQNVTCECVIPPYLTCTVKV